MLKANKKYSDYTGLIDNVIAIEIKSYSIKELEDKSSSEMSDLAGELLEAFACRLISKFYGKLYTKATLQKL